MPVLRMKWKSTRQYSQTSSIGSLWTSADSFDHRLGPWRLMITGMSLENRNTQGLHRASTNVALSSYRGLDDIYTLLYHQSN